MEGFRFWGHIRDFAETLQKLLRTTVFRARRRNGNRWYDLSSGHFQAFVSPRFRSLALAAASASGVTHIRPASGSVLRSTNFSDSKKISDHISHVADLQSSILLNVQTTTSLHFSPKRLISYLHQPCKPKTQTHHSLFP